MGRQRGVSASSYGSELLQRKKAELELTNEVIASRAKLDTKTVSRFLNGKQPVDISSVYKIVKVLGLKYNQVVESASDIEEATAEVIDDLQERSDDGQAEQIIQGLEQSLTKYLNSEEVEVAAIKWLDVHGDDILGIEFIDNELIKLKSENSFYENVNAETLIEDLKKYLKAVQYCLKLGTINFIDAAMADRLLPGRYDASIYIYFLEYIKDFRMIGRVPSNILEKLLIPIEYIIDILPYKL